MNVYTISRNLTSLFTVNAESHEAAATKAAKRLTGRGLNTRRTTGDAGKSGYFQAYEPVPATLGGGLNSVGEPFHVS